MGKNEEDLDIKVNFKPSAWQNGKLSKAETSIHDSLWGLTKILSRRQLRLPLPSVIEAVKKKTL